MPPLHLPLAYLCLLFALVFLCVCWCVVQALVAGDEVMRWLAGAKKEP